MGRSHPRGYVLLVGPDGSGKTAVADALEALARDANVAVLRAHYRPGLLFPRGGDGAPVKDPHGQKPRGLLRSLVKLAVVFVDSLIGDWLLWKPAARRGLLIVERGWWDLAVDPRRYRLDSRLVTLVRLLGRAVHRADLIAVLAGDPAVLAKRKREIGVVEIDRQMAAWRIITRHAASRMVEHCTTSSLPGEIAQSLWQDLGRDARGWRAVPFAPSRLDMRSSGDPSALAVYRPLTRRSRIAAASHRPLLSLRAARHSTSPFAELEDLVSGLGFSRDGLVSFRSTAPGRWIVGVAHGGELAAVIKIGPSCDDGLKREATILSRIVGGSGSFAVPAVLSAGAISDYFVLATEAVPVRQRPVVNVELASVIASELVRGLEGVGPVLHGDFTPWNVLPASDEATVVDWESADAARAPLFDLAHFVVRAGALLGRFGPRVALNLLTTPGGPGARHLEAVDEDVGQAPTLLSAYLESNRVVVSDPREIRFRSELAALIDRERVSV